MSLVSEAMEQINLTVSDLLQRRLKLADDTNTPPGLRDSIYRDLIDMYRETERTSETIMRLSGSRMMLKPAKDHHEIDIEK